MTNVTSIHAAHQTDARIEAQAKRWVEHYLATLASTPVPSKAAAAKFKPLIDAANAAAATSTSTQWSGESTMRIYASVCRDIQALMVRSRVLKHVPSGIELQVLAGIPERLIMATCHFVAEALTAIRNAMGDKPGADLALNHLRNIANNVALKPMMVTHEVMQSQAFQIGELQYWSGERGQLITNVCELCGLIIKTCSVSIAFAPASNFKATLVLDEALMHIDELLAVRKLYAA